MRFVKINPHQWVGQEDALRPEDKDFVKQVVKRLKSAHPDKWNESTNDVVQSTQGETADGRAYTTEYYEMMKDSVSVIVQKRVGAGYRKSENIEIFVDNQSVGRYKIHQIRKSGGSETVENGYRRIKNLYEHIVKITKPLVDAELQRRAQSGEVPEENVGDAKQQAEDDVRLQEQQRRNEILNRL